MFDEPFFYMGMPINKDGDGPADDSDAYRIIHEVWDGNFATVCRCTDEPSARWVASTLNRGAAE